MAGTWPSVPHSVQVCPNFSNALSSPTLPCTPLLLLRHICQVLPLLHAEKSPLTGQAAGLAVQNCMPITCGCPHLLVAKSLIAGGDDTSDAAAVRSAASIPPAVVFRVCATLIALFASPYRTMSRLQGSLACENLV